MNFTYNILWLDDEDIKSFDDLQVAYKDKLSLEKVNYIDICEMTLQSNPEKFHAVILDVNGINHDKIDKKAQKSDFLPLFDKITREYHLPIYVYSGQIDRFEDGANTDVILNMLRNTYHLEMDQQIFMKSGGPFDLMDKILNDLDNKYQNYIGYEDYLSYFAKHWLPIECKYQFLDPLMEYYKNKDYASAHGNQMRNLVEAMIDKVNETKSWAENMCSNDTGRYKQMIDRFRCKMPDKFKYIIGPLYYVNEIANYQSHFTIPEKESKLIFESDFSAFFLIANWFGEVMKEIEAVPKESEMLASPQVSKSNVSPSSKKDTQSKVRSVKCEVFTKGNRPYIEIKVDIPRKYEKCKEVQVKSIKPDTYKTGSWYVDFVD